MVRSVLELEWGKRGRRWQDSRDVEASSGPKPWRGPVRCKSDSSRQTRCTMREGERERGAEVDVTRRSECGTARRQHENGHERGWDAHSILKTRGSSGMPQ
jgi:hypothetical protein